MARVEKMMSDKLASAMVASPECGVVMIAARAPRRKPRRCIFYEPSLT
jgi:hypothetical protein